MKKAFIIILIAVLGTVAFLWYDKKHFGGEERAVMDLEKTVSDETVIPDGTELDEENQDTSSGTTQGKALGQTSGGMNANTSADIDAALKDISTFNSSDTSGYGEAFSY